jgi:hypothetical protein
VRVSHNTEDYELTPEQRLRCLHNVFAGEALRYFNLHVEGNHSLFSTAVAAMEAEFNSTTRQMRAKIFLKEIRLTEIQASERLTTADALDRLREIITTMLPQCSKTHRDEAHKVEFLYLAVVGSPWASSPLSRAAACNSDFQTLFTDLHAALHQHHEETTARKNETIHTRVKSFSHSGGTSSFAAETNPPQLYFQGKGRYANARQPGSKSSAPAHSSAHATGTTTPGKNGVDRFGNIKRCFNCKDPNHILPCPHPRQCTTAAAEMIRKNPAHTRRIFLEFIEQVEAMESVDHEDYAKMFLAKADSEISNANDEYFETESPSNKGSHLNCASGRAERSQPSNLLPQAYHTLAKAANEHGNTGQELIGELSPEDF